MLYESHAVNPAPPLLPFEEWLDATFASPLAHPWPDPGESWGVYPPVILVDYLTRLFEQAATLLSPYTDGQVNRGLWFLLSTDSEAGDALLDRRVPWAARARCLMGVQTLFATCFTRRCAPVLSHLDEPTTSDLNSACYMWWDLFPTWGRPDRRDHAQSDTLLLRVMADILTLDHDACRESALHGLGHWAHHYPERVETLIDRFLAAQPQLRPELERYAKAARCGCVQ